MTNVVLVGGSEETRLLLRGLLRLHRFRVLAEGPTFETMGRVPEGPDPVVAVVDLDFQYTDTLQTLQDARKNRPKLRIVLLAPHRSEQLERRAREAGVGTMVRRPFAVTELITAVESAVPREPMLVVPTPPAPELLPAVPSTVPAEPTLVGPTPVAPG